MDESPTNERTGVHLGPEDSTFLRQLSPCSQLLKSYVLRPTTKKASLSPTRESPHAVGPTEHNINKLKKPKDQLLPPSLQVRGRGYFTLEGPIFPHLKQHRMITCSGPLGWPRPVWPHSPPHCERLMGDLRGRGQPPRPLWPP